MKNDTTFVRMRNSDHLGDAKMSKKTPRSSVEFNLLTNCRRQKRFLFCRTKEIYKFCLQLDLIIAQGLSYDLQSLVIILPRFRLLKTVTTSLGKK